MARHEAGDATYPFATADWDVPADVTKSLSSGRLRLAMPGTDGNWRDALYNGVASRAKAFVQALVRSASQSNATSRGVAAHVTDITAGSNDSAGLSSTVENSTELSRLIEWVNAGATVHTSQVCSAKAVGTDYRFSLFVDGSSAEGYDFDAALSHLATLGTQASGQLGITSTNNGAMEASAFFAMADRYVTVQDVPTGGSAEVLDTGDVVLASAAESGGVATIDVLQVAFPAPAKVQVQDDQGAVVGSVSPTDGVWGGDVYAATNSPPDTPTCSVKTLAVDTLVLESGAFSDPDGDGQAASHWQAQAAGGDWSVLLHESADDAVNLMEWDVPDPTMDVEMEARVRHKDDSGDAGTEWSAWSAATAPFTVPSSVWEACPSPSATVWEACAALESTGELEDGQFFTDFSDYDVGALTDHADWGLGTGGDAGWFSVVEEAGAGGGKVVRVQRVTTDIFNFALWSAPGTDDVLEIVARMRFYSPVNYDSHLGLVIGDYAGSHYQVGEVDQRVDLTNHRLNIGKYTVSGGLSPDQGSALDFTGQASWWWWLRAQHNRSTGVLRVRFWWDGENEPGTWSEVSASRNLALPGIFYGGGPNGAAEYGDIDLIGVGVGGVAAPIELPEAMVNWAACEAAGSAPFVEDF
ncbi:MAG TPA: hypothetical protein VKA48_01430 [Gammaproteobacteria bacterium]|nr:hypothetical protein [Gammaproteobacteria bacterium]